MKAILKLPTVIIVTLLIVDVAFAINENDNKSEKTSSLIRPETNYLLNETETGWEENGTLINKEDSLQCATIFKCSVKTIFFY